MLEEAKGEGRAGRLGFKTESKEWIRETVSDMAETALVGPPDLPWRRIVGSWHCRGGSSDERGDRGFQLQHQ